MDAQKIKEIALANGFSLKQQTSGNMDLHSYVYEFAEALLKEAEIQAVPEGFVLVPKTDVYDYYIANHLKGTTCSVDVSELTGNDGDRIYGKLRQYDCLGSDGNTLIYDLESSNFKLGKRTGNTGDYVLVPKEPTEEMIQAGRDERRDLGTVASTYKAMIEAAQEQP